MAGHELHRLTDDELRDRLLAGAPCPQCDFDRVIYRDTVSDFVAYIMHMMHCPRCGLTVQWEHRQVGENPETVIVDVSGRAARPRAL